MNAWPKLAATGRRAKSMLAIALLSSFVATPARAQWNAPVAITRLSPTTADAPGVTLQPASYVELRAAVWTPDEKRVVALVSRAGSFAPVDTSVVMWEVASGRLVSWVHLPDFPLGPEVYIHAIAIFATLDDGELQVALSTAKGQQGGPCANAVLRTSLSSPDSRWTVDEDRNTPAVCASSPPRGLVSPSGRLAIVPTASGFAIRQQTKGRGSNLLTIPPELVAATELPYVSRSGLPLLQQFPAIVLQTRSSAEEVKRAVWTINEDQIVALVGTRGSDAPRDMVIIVWDLKTNTIVNRVPLPVLEQITDLHVHEMHLTADSKVELRGTARVLDGSCQSMLLAFDFAQRSPWKRRYDLNRAENCEPTNSTDWGSPSGKRTLTTRDGRPVVRDAKGIIEAILDKPETLVLADAAISPDGRTLALIGEPATGGTRSMMMLGLESSKLRVVPLAHTNGAVDRIVWLENGGVSGVRDVLPDALTEQHAPAARSAIQVASRPPVLLIAAPDKSDGWLEYDSVRGTVERIRPEGQNVAPRKLLFQNVVRAGVVPGAPMAWIATRTGGLVWIDAKSLGDEQPPVTFFLPGGKFFVQGHFAYDTNLPADTDLFRWVDFGDGLHSLGPQTYMRLSFEPQLLRRMIACARSPECDLLPNSKIPQINRALPSVAIENVKPGPRPNTAEVSIVLHEGQRATKRFGNSTSGAYNLRLFRNGSLVAQYPPVGESANADIDSWRERNHIALGADGTARVNLTVALPTSRQIQVADLSAYAFNDDRVKSEAARTAYPLARSSAPRPRRAFVIAIGIDEYLESRLKLRFAASDARLLGDRLGKIPGYSVMRTTLASSDATGRTFAVTAATIGWAIDILAGRNIARARTALAEGGFDATQLATATPDDIVIVSFSGHGWADKGGSFYILPSNARWPEGAAPDLTSLISATQIADRLRDVDAGEMALIIDACHSAASVAGGGFRPGPMGDPGLGQLAFDKGIRILAATQADDVALEDPTLKQGLLTYALASEGITASGGAADENADGRITLDEWLRYATQRMPSLAADLGLRHIAVDGTRSRGWVPAISRSPERVQEPALFDFTGKASMIVLRERIGG